MTAEEKYEYWRELAAYDLESASAMYSKGRWYYVAFMCQQSIEKLCKGLYTLYLNDNIPRIHNIKQIFMCFEAKLSINVVDEEKYSLFDTLSAYYLTSRYPDYNRQTRQQINKDEAKILLKKSKEVFSWLLTLKPLPNSPKIMP
jgi:HEPN domain-containing protein